MEHYEVQIFRLHCELVARTEQLLKIQSSPRSVIEIYFPVFGVETLEVDYNFEDFAILFMCIRVYSIDPYCKGHDSCSGRWNLLGLYTIKSLAHQRTVPDATQDTTRCPVLPISCPSPPMIFPFCETDRLVKARISRMVMPQVSS